MAGTKYLVKTPWWLRLLYPSFEWYKSQARQSVFLTFDDGPHPEITPWVMDLLDRYQFGASFFLIGENVLKNPETYQSLNASRHSLGSHTMEHLHGWKVPDDQYLDSFRKGHELVNTNLFRPPYGWIRRSQARKILPTHRIIMWDIVSGDFDTGIGAQQCTENVIRHLRPGSIIVFHDSEKAWPRLKESLPIVLEEINRRGWRSESL